jgi:LPS export ABC transporter protein LptC
MRKQLRRVLTAVFVLVLGSVAVLVGRTMWRQWQAELLTRGVEMLPGVSQHIRDFRRVKLKDGRKVWEVAAKEAHYIDDEASVIVRSALVKWYLEDGREIGLRGDEGRILLDGSEVRRVELSGGIEVTLADYVVSTDRAAYDHAENRISAPGSVSVSGEALDLSGEGMSVDVERQRLYLTRGVSMVLRPGPLEEASDELPL